MQKIITISTFLKQIKPLNVELISGENGINKKMEYINIQEFALKSNRIKKHGVLMTTFASLPDSQKIIEHLQWLLSKEIHAVGIHSVFIKKIPDEVISFSNANNLPIFLIPEEVSYQQIMQVYFELLVEDTNKKRLELEQINIKMLKSVALDKGAQYIVSIMGKYLKLPLIHLDKHLNIQSLWTEGLINRNEVQHIIEQLTSKQADFYRSEETFSYNAPSEKLNISSLRVLPLMDNMNFYGCLILVFKKDFSVLDDSVINHGKTALLLDSIKSNTMEKYFINNDIKTIEAILRTPSKRDADFNKPYLYSKDLKQIYLIEFYNPTNFIKLLNSFTKKLLNGIMLH
ncbi:PucR family transcriptional regulator ligand-binding domain-containing protein [Oceanobacillus kapialis]|uniref:PucR family transcriptional regulator ligand-binding domain-containing protein n=1 Tax=Oceanobacillus kapialis TaxID=481353 RepID=A0ABW5PW68_9BACI